MLTLVAVLTLNGWLVVLNLAKHDRLPAGLEPLPGVEAAQRRGTADGIAGPPGANGGDAAAERGVPSSATLLTDDGAVPGIVVSGDEDWPGGTGPAPDGPPSPRRVLVEADGDVRLVGSAPAWSVVTALVDRVSGELGITSLDMRLEIGWHPEAPDRADAVDVVLAEPLRYADGAIALPDEAPDRLAPVVAILAARPGTYAVVVGRVAGEDGGDGATDGGRSAVVLARVTAVADQLVASGVDRSRVVTVVAPEPDGDGRGTAAVVGDGNEIVEVRLENVLTASAVG